MLKKALFVVLLTLTVAGCSSDKAEQKKPQQNDSGYKGTLSVYSMNGKNIANFKGTVDDFDYSLYDCVKIKLEDNRYAIIHGGVTIFMEDKKGNANPNLK